MLHNISSRLPALLIEMGGNVFGNIREVTDNLLFDSLKGEKPYQPNKRSVAGNLGK